MTDTVPVELESRETRGYAAEIKFLTSAAQAESIRAWARARLDPDPHGAGTNRDEYLTTSIYFDTPDLDVFNRRGSHGRAKYRIRRYGRDDVAFLERKLRSSSVLAKRRTPILIDDLASLGNPRAAAAWEGRWFEQRVRVRALQPSIQVSYRRTARVAVTDHGVARLTIDQDLCGLPSAGLRFSRGAGLPVLDGRAIVEMKFRVAAPVVFKQLIEEFGLTRAAISKYRLSFAALGTHAATLEPVWNDPRADLACA